MPDPNFKVSQIATRSTLHISYKHQKAFIGAKVVILVKRSPTPRKYFPNFCRLFMTKIWDCEPLPPAGWETNYSAPVSMIDDDGGDDDDRTGPTGYTEDHIAASDNA